MEVEVYWWGFTLKPINEEECILLANLFKDAKVTHEYETDQPFEINEQNGEVTLWNRM